MAGVIPQNYGNDYSNFYTDTIKNKFTNIGDNETIQQKIKNTMQHYSKNEEYNENTKNVYYEQYMNIFNITLGIIGLTYSIYSTMFVVNTNTIRGGRNR